MATDHGNNLQPLHCDLQPAIQQAHMSNHTLQNTEGEPIWQWDDRSRTRRTHEVPFVAACSHFTRKNTRFRAPASSPTQAPCNIHAAPFVRCIVVWCIVVWCIVMWCIVMWCIVVWCIVMWCVVMWCIVTASPPFVRCIVVWYIVMWRIVSQFYLTVTRKIASQLPLIIHKYIKSGQIIIFQGL